VFVAVCAYCGEDIDRIPVEQGETWGPASSWAHLAIKAHESTCEPYQQAKAAPDPNPLL